MARRGRSSAVRATFLLLREGRRTFAEGPLRRTAADAGQAFAQLNLRPIRSMTRVLGSEQLTLNQRVRGLELHVAATDGSEIAQFGLHAVPRTSLDSGAASCARVREGTASCRPFRAQDSELSSRKSARTAVQLQQQVCVGRYSSSLHIQDEAIGVSAFARAAASFDERSGSSTVSSRLCRHSTRP